MKSFETKIALAKDDIPLFKKNPEETKSEIGLLKLSFSTTNQTMVLLSQKASLQA